MNYYNEIDLYCVEWLRALIDKGLIPDGVVDSRPIQEIEPSDLKGFKQCHFFAGLGGWAYALELANYDGPVWTGSCPCQPFSAAGKQKGGADERHLWPVWYELIRVCKPPKIFGEQVAAAIKHGWIDLVQSDMEREDYALRFAVLPACSVGAPHIRQRLWFVGDAQFLGSGRDAGTGLEAEGGSEMRSERYHPRSSSAVDRVAHSERAGREGGLPGRENTGREVGDGEPLRGGNGGVANPSSKGAEGVLREESSSRSQAGPEFEGRSGIGMAHTPAQGLPVGRRGSSAQSRQIKQLERLCSAWESEWVPCKDGKQRPVKPGVRLLAHGVPSRVAKLRAIGNAICPQTAAAFVLACH